jgi:branched-chain amino acid transport system ATP-binding protein
MAEALLKVEKLAKSFDGNVIMHNINFSVPQGELSAIIGPNGAGKTTLFNLITGYHLPDSGQVFFEGRNIARRQPYEIVRLGIARAFQRTNIFPRLSVLENMVATVISYRKGSLNMVQPVSKLRNVEERAREILNNVGLGAMTDRQSGTLPHGDQKRLDIAMALALEPKLLLLDEPTAGISPEERWQVIDLVHGLWDRLKITMIFIEHDMDIVFKIAQTIRVLCYGTLLAEGPPEEISRNEKVIEAYLGEEVT